jgi:cyclopropane fatty-acyl-phospholipid synthase-like methyltransferase
MDAMEYVGNRKEFFKYVNNKKVIIVGPAKYLDGSGMGEFIDSYDIIVRLNNSYPIKKESFVDLGSRTDVLFHTGAINTTLKYAANQLGLGRIETLELNKLKWFISKRNPITGGKAEKVMIDKITDLIEKRNSKIKTVAIETFFLRKLRARLENTDPNMSTLAIMYLLQTSLKELYICGCDFYGTGYNDGYTVSPDWLWEDSKKRLVRKDNKKPRTPKIRHDWEIQKKFLLKLNEKRIKMDKTFSEALKGKKSKDKTDKVVQNTLEETQKYWTNPPDKNTTDKYIIHTERSEFLYNVIQKYIKKDSNIIEYGCNCGRNLNYLFEKGHTNLTGIELNQDAIKLMQKEYAEMSEAIKICNGTIESFVDEFSENEFDLGISMLVFNHIHPDSNWIFEKIAHACKMLVTIESEDKDGSRTFKRNYKDVFEQYNFSQVEELSCSEESGLSSKYIVRILKKNIVKKTRTKKTKVEEVENITEGEDNGES